MPNQFASVGKFLQFSGVTLVYCHRISGLVVHLNYYG